LLAGDCIAINSAWVLFYLLRNTSGFFYTNVTNINPAHVLNSSIIIYSFWLVAFLVFGLYRQWYVRPIFDEIITILKTLGVGTLLMLLFIFWDPMSDQDIQPTRNDPRILGLLYFAILSACVISLRLVVRFSQRRLLESGYGRRTSIILGEKEKVIELAQQVFLYPRLGYDVVGYVSPNGKGDEVISVSGKYIKRLGESKDIENIIDEYRIGEVLITLGSGEHDKLLDIVGRASRSNAGLKIVPDLYDIISGQARTREIYGFPLIDINPELQRPWEETAKRTLDIVVSTSVLIIGAPIWLLTAMLVKLTSPGPVIYSQERVGKNGESFRIYKFRSMRTDSETSGPVWAVKNDPRVTAFGKFIRKTHLDEIPQFWNVLRGDMSLVGPRPERPHFVKLLSEEIPYYRRRLKVRPGVTGLFQAMEYKYDESIDDVKNKLKYDLMYIESMSFRLDIKIIFKTAFRMLRGKGQA
jgi:exopolysaccharide biosynthesis polyprenyl glycosylphosphotransferase